MSIESFSDFKAGFRKFCGLNPTFKMPKPLPIKPQFAILSNGGGYTTPRAIRKIENETNATTKAINYESPLDDTDDLEKEVKNGLKFIDENKLYLKYVSRAEAYLDLVKEGRIHAPLSLTVIRKVQKEAEKLDAIFLPGGEDIPSIWYGGEDHKYQYRSLVEITLINEARKRGIPLMAVCRGFQMVNVFNGKKLENDVPGQYGVQTFNLMGKKEDKGLIGDIFRDGVKGGVMHHQGVSIEQGVNGGGELEPLTHADGLIKAAESKFPAAAPIIVTQFHPEMYESNSRDLSSNNETFFKIFHESSKTRVKKNLITAEKLIEAKKRLKPLPLVPPKVKNPSVSRSFKILAEISL